MFREPHACEYSHSSSVGRQGQRGVQCVYCVLHALRRLCYLNVFLKFVKKKPIETVLDAKININDGCSGLEINSKRTCGSRFFLSLISDQLPKTLEKLR